MEIMGVRLLKFKISSKSPYTITKSFEISNLVITDMCEGSSYYPITSVYFHICKDSQWPESAASEQADYVSCYWLMISNNGRTTISMVDSYSSNIEVRVTSRMTYTSLIFHNKQQYANDCRIISSGVTINDVSAKIINQSAIINCFF